MHIANDYVDNNNNNTHNINNIIVKDPHIFCRVAPTRYPVLLFSIQFDFLSAVVKWSWKANSWGSNAIVMQCSRFSTKNFQRPQSRQFKVPNQKNRHTYIHTKCLTLWNVKADNLFMLSSEYFFFLFGNLIYTLSNKNVALAK